MNTEYKNNIYFQEDEMPDYRELFMKWLHHWHWFLISFSIVGLTTAYYLRRTIPEYNVSATILIKDAKKDVGDAMSEIAAFQDLGMFSDSRNSLDNEIEILKSRSLLAKVIKELNLNVQYKSLSVFICWHRYSTLLHIISITKVNVKHWTQKICLKNINGFSRN